MKSDQATETISTDSLLALLQMQQVTIDEKDRQIEDSLVPNVLVGNPY